MEYGDGIMNQEAESPKLVITVKLVYGEKVTHTIEVPTDRVQATKLTDQLANLVIAAMQRKKDTCLHLLNPTITYNPENISYIRFDAEGGDEWQEVVRQVQEKIGFVK
jgi:hypothetical protein